MGKSGPMNCGNVNMKGKKYKLLACKCCECQDFREKMLNKAINKELFEDPNEYDEYDWEPYEDWWELCDENINWNEYKQK